ncbi:MAG: endolytic transglycosylase MltG [Chloroflexi bacterium]|nr:endolytic transglycosylase MltG [Chloroflexota bacterium]
MRWIWAGATGVALLFVALAVLLSLDVPGAATNARESDGAGQRLSPLTATVVVSEGDSARAIGEALFAAGVIDSPARFETLVALFGYESNLAAGTYDLEDGLSTTEIIERIRAGITAPVVFTAPEGLRLEQVAERLEDLGIVPAVDFLIATRTPQNWAGTLAAGRPAGTSIEGYLFPSTYRLSARTTADQIVRAMLERFDSEVGGRLASAARATGRSLHDIITMASIVEREAVVSAERPTIASVFWNRIDRAIPLQADPTVQYALTDDPATVETFGYWKGELTADDLTHQSLFNTYVVLGLPPGPIASPGLPSIEAATFPEITELLYFVARGDGSHAFAETFEAHLENVLLFQGDGGAQ